MKRAPIVLSATAAGVAATLGFHAHTAPAPAATASTAHSTSAASATTATATTAAASTAVKKQSTATASTRTITSDPVTNQYGTVQLKVVVRDGKITDITSLQLPANDPKSAEINAYAAPILRQSTLTTQSADIDGVSGATYTSESYKTALQSVLDKVTLAANAANS